MKTAFYSFVTLLILMIASSTEAQITLTYTGTPSVSGTAGAVGAKYTWGNVGTTNSITIKSVIEIISIAGGASLEAIDQSTYGSANAWQPIINGSQSNGCCWGIEFRIRFYNASTNARLTLSSFKAQGIDIDGDGCYLREYNRFDKPASYTVESNTYLTGTLSSGNYTFKGPTTTVDGIDLTQTRYIVSCLYANTDSVNLVLGSCCDGGSCASSSGNRLHSVNFCNAVTYCDPVPVNMVYYNTESKGETALITWATATEVNNSHFELYRSDDGQSWTKIGEIKGNGNSNRVIEYSFTDEQPLVLNYYKLKQIDFNGNFEYTHVRIVDFEAGKIIIQGYPNPTNGKLTLDINKASEADAVQIEIFDMQGLLIQTLNIEPNGSQNVLTPVDISNTRSGLYLVRVSSGQSIQNYKLIKY